MDKLVEVYRGVAIELTAEVLGFNVGARDAFCFTLRERAEDSAPIIDMFSSVEDAREAIDEELEIDASQSDASVYHPAKVEA